MKNDDFEKIDVVHSLQNSDLSYDELETFKSREKKKRDGSTSKNSRNKTGNKSGFKKAATRKISSGYVMTKSVASPVPNSSKQGQIGSNLHKKKKKQEEHSKSSS